MMFEDPRSFKLLVKATQRWRNSSKTKEQWERYAINMAAKDPGGSIGKAFEHGNLRWVSKIVWGN